MLKVVIAVINASALVGQEELRAVTAALQVQVSRDFAPAWNADAELIVVEPGESPPPKCWWAVILDNSDLGTALGYHDLTSDRLPMAKIFVETARQGGDEWSVIFSHEVLEMLADPYLNLTAAVPTAYGYVICSYENCDACQSQEAGYEVEGHLLSDFCLPDWFDASKWGSGRTFDHCGHIGQPFELLPGGYAMCTSPPYYSGWHLVLGPSAESQKAVRPRVGSRRERRRTDSLLWQPSEAEPARSPELARAARRARSAQTQPA